MTEDLPTPEENKEKSERLGRAMSEQEVSGVPPFDDSDLPYTDPFEEGSSSETLILDIDQPDSARVMGTDCFTPFTSVA